MPEIADYAYDQALNAVKAATTFHLLASEPADLAAVTAGTLANKDITGLITGPADRTPSGRKVTVPALTGGSVTATGTASHWAIVDGTRKLASGALASSQGLTSGNTFSTTGSFDIGIPDAT